MHFCHATTLQLRAFLRHSASWPAAPTATRNFDFSFSVINRGDLYCLGYKHTRLTALCLGLPG